MDSGDFFLSCKERKLALEYCCAAKDRHMPLNGLKKLLFTIQRGEIVITYCYNNKGVFEYYRRVLLHLKAKGNAHKNPLCSTLTHKNTCKSFFRRNNFRLKHTSFHFINRSSTRLQGGGVSCSISTTSTKILFDFQVWPPLNLC